MVRLSKFAALLALCVSAEAQEVFPGPIMRTIAAAGGGAINTAVFDGTNDRIVNSSALNAVADGKAFTCAVWVQFNGGSGGNQEIFAIQDGGSVRLRVRRNTLNNITLFATDSSGVTILNATSSVTIADGAGWVHVYATIDLANAGNRHVYFSGTEDASVTWTTYSNATIDMAALTPVTAIGALSSGLNRLNGALAEFWFDDAYFNDPTKFVSGGVPVSLGTNGQTPTGSPPAIYLSTNGSGDSWAVDSSGNSNTFTVTGSLGTTTPP